METRLTLYQAIVQLYEQLYRQASMRTNFVLNTNVNQRKMLCKFIAWLVETYGKKGQLDSTLLVKFFEFQFSRWSGITTPYGKNIVMLNWIVGAKAIEEWVKRNPRKHYIVKWRINKDFHLKLNQVFAEVRKQRGIKRQRNMVLDTEHEESAKLRFHNHGKGYVYCAQQTTLYNKSSAACDTCIFKVTCQERLKLIYPKIFELRKHEYGD